VSDTVVMSRPADIEWLCLLVIVYADFTLGPKMAFTERTRSE